MKELFEKYMSKAGFFSSKEKGDEKMTPNEQALHIRDRYLQYTYPYQLMSNPSVQGITPVEETDNTYSQNSNVSVTQTEIPVIGNTPEFTEQTPYFKTPKGTRMGYVIISILLISAILVIYGLTHFIG